LSSLRAFERPVRQAPPRAHSADSRRRRAWSCSPDGPTTLGACEAERRQRRSECRKVWRRSWKRIGRTSARSSASLKRLEVPLQLASHPLNHRHRPGRAPRLRRAETAAGCSCAAPDRSSRPSNKARAQSHRSRPQRPLEQRLEFPEVEIVDIRIGSRRPRAVHAGNRIDDNPLATPGAPTSSSPGAVCRLVRGAGIGTRGQASIDLTDEIVAALDGGRSVTVAAQHRYLLISQIIRFLARGPRSKKGPRSSQTPFAPPLLAAKGRLALASPSTFPQFSRGPT
jgi:hypothetical protein